LGKITSELMSDEESGEDGALLKRHLPWRSDAVNRLIDKIDQIPCASHSISKVRIVGDFSLRRPKGLLSEELLLVENNTNDDG